MPTYKKTKKRHAIIQALKKKPNIAIFQSLIYRKAANFQANSSRITHCEGGQNRHNRFKIDRNA